MPASTLQLGPVSEVATDSADMGAGLSDLEMGAWAGFLRTYATLVRDLDDELTREHGLPLSHYDVLVQLADAQDGQMRMSQLADAVLLSRSGLSRLVARLVDQGLVSRNECPSDGRGALAALTAAGRDRLEEARETHRSGVRRRFLGRLSESQQRQLGAAWRRILA